MRRCQPLRAGSTVRTAQCSHRGGHSARRAPPPTGSYPEPGLLAGISASRRRHDGRCRRQRGSTPRKPPPFGRTSGGSGGSPPERRSPPVPDRRGRQTAADRAGLPPEPPLVRSGGLAAAAAGLVPTGSGRVDSRPLLQRHHDTRGCTGAAPNSVKCLLILKRSINKRHSQQRSLPHIRKQCRWGGEELPKIVVNIANFSILKNLFLCSPCK